MSDLLSIGASGVRAYRSALSIVGDNVANVETEGYSRRTVNLSRSISSFGSDPLSLDRITAGGIAQASVVRAWDDFRASESRVSQADAARADTRVRWLSNVETALDDGESGVGVAVTTFFNRAQTLAAEPNGATQRRAFMNALGDVTANFRESSDALSRAAQGIRSEAGATVGELNGNLKALAQVNDALKRAAPDSVASTSLSDTRDRLLDDIAKKVGVDVRIGERGVATVTLAGANAVTLVDGNVPADVVLRTADDGRLSLDLTLGGVMSSGTPASGALAGLLDVAATVTGRRADLDAIATQFAADVNGWQAGGFTAAGAAGAPLLTIVGGALGLKLATDDPSAIAAASDKNANGNLTALQSLREGGTESRLAAIVTHHALTVASAKSEAAAAANRRDNAFSARDEVGGIDLDREAAELLRYQQAYNGSAKLIQVARETLQSILNLF